MHSSQIIPIGVSIAAIVDELKGAAFGLARNNVKVDDSLIDDLILRFSFIQHKTDERFFLQGTFDNYKLWPPIWDWYNTTWSDSTCKKLSPASSSTPTLPPMFIEHKGKGIICAPFNRLAYGILNGPHPDWETLEGWNKHTSSMYADTIGDMLQLIHFDLEHSKGRMGLNTQSDD